MRKGLEHRVILYLTEADDVRQRHIQVFSGDDTGYVLDFTPIAARRPLSWSIGQKLAIVEAFVVARIEEILYIPGEKAERTGTSHVDAG